MINKLPELYALCKANGIKGCSRKGKKEILEILREKGLVAPEEPKEVKEPREIDPKYLHLREIRTKPRAVILTDADGNTVSYPSLYKAAKFLEKRPASLYNYEGTEKRANEYLVSFQ